MKKPFIKLFSCSAGKYLYDTNSNQILEISEESYGELLNYMNGNEDYEVQEQDWNEEIRNLIEQGKLSCLRPNVIEHELSPYVKQYLNKRVQGITLQLTQGCNFRCRYCSFSGDGYYDREHNGKRMSTDIAYKAIKFLKEHSEEMKKVRINYYGGEPLLEFQLIKDTVEYAKSIMPEKELVFAMTSNASLLTEEMLDFLVENEFSFAISLDGPQALHDKYRRFAADGRGTYEAVVKSLKMVHDKYPDYYKRNISISAVIDDNDDLSMVSEFFKQEIFKDVTIHFSILDSTKNDIKKNPTQDFFDSYNENLVKMMINHKVQNESEDPLHVHDVLFSNTKDLHEMDENLMAKNQLTIAHHSGPCIPGQSKLFVEADGDLFTCEKASGKSSTMKIGNLEEGYDYEAIFKLLNVGKLTEEECKNCWAIRFCSVCAINIDNLDQLSRDLKLQECKITRRRILSTMKNYVTINKMKGLRE